MTIARVDDDRANSINALSNARTASEIALYDGKVRRWEGANAQLTPPRISISVMHTFSSGHMAAHASRGMTNNCCMEASLKAHACIHPSILGRAPVPSYNTTVRDM